MLDNKKSGIPSRLFLCPNKKKLNEIAVQVAKLALAQSSIKAGDVYVLMHGLGSVAIYVFHLHQPRASRDKVRKAPIGAGTPGLLVACRYIASSTGRHHGGMAGSSRDGDASSIGSADPANLPVDPSAGDPCREHLLFRARRERNG